MVRAHVHILAGISALLVLGTQQVASLGQKQCITFPDTGRGGHRHGHHGLNNDDDQTVFSADRSTHDDKTDSDLSHTLILASAHNHHALPLLLDSTDDDAIHLAAASFARDVEKVTGVKPHLYNNTLPKGVERCIMVGSASSGLVGGMGLDHVEAIKGKWEAFDVRVVEGARGLKQALVIAGSDRRGTVFGLYDLSEQLGISPWYWWDDVQIPKHNTIGFTRNAICAHGEPTVKYRGMFINDEIPVLWNWAKNYFKIEYPESPIQVGVYERLYETTLRMKGNFMWPAMWVSMFAADGTNPQKNGLPREPVPGPNQALAHRMGIIMGTSHHEPMSRNKPEWDLEGTGDWDWRNNEKKLTEWWTYGAERAKGLDTVFTVGLRGDGDRPLQGASVELLEEITSKQQDILKKVYGNNGGETVPQLWALYKEVQGYYLQGMNIPDDVTTLFADDNWGNIMGVLPYDHNHTAGGGIYYHADYVGTPTQYKWVNEVNLAKTWQQMQIANAFRTNQIWIINVGDVKHHELPAEHFMHLAYDFEAWPRNSITKFLRLWAAREFGHEHSHEIADIMGHYSQLTARLKIELYNTTSYSYINYEEAERVEATWDALFARAEKVYHALPKARRIAFFEVVYAPVALITHANRMYIAAGKNNLYAYQARTSTNRMGEKAIREFQQDHNLTDIYHTMLHGRWNHMLSQPHLNMDTQFPLHRLANTVPPISYIQEQEPAMPRWDGTRPGQASYVRYSVENSFGAWPGHNKFNCPSQIECPEPQLYRMDPYGAKRRWVEVSAGGPKDSTWRAYPSADWLVVRPEHGKIKKNGSSDQRVYVSIDWNKVPNAGEGNHTHWDNATVHFAASDGSNLTISTPISKPNPPPADFKGHVQGDGYVVMEAAHWSKRSSADGYQFEEIEWYGRALSGIEMYPTTDVNFTLGTGPSVEYDFWTTGTGLKPDTPVEVTVQLGPAFNFQLGKELSFGIALDGEKREFQPIPGVSSEKDAGSIPKDWQGVTRTEVRNVTTTFDLHAADQPGKHTVTLYGMSSGVVIERVWVDLGGIRSRGYSFLGPPESHRIV